MTLKKMLSVSLVIIVVMFGLMLTTSYAWYSYEGGSTTFDANTSNNAITVVYQTGEYINNNTAIPITSDEIDKYADKNNFNIKVNNKKEYNDVMISVSLVDVEIDDELKNSSFKVELFYQGTSIKTITGDKFSTGTDLVLDNVLLDDDLTNFFEIRVYILDDNSDQSVMMNKSFKGKISIEVLSRVPVSMMNFGSSSDLYISSITIDGNSSDNLPTSGYYTMSSTCSKGSTLSWEPLSKTITYEAGSKIADACSLTFTSSDDYPLLNTMPVGSYVKYVGKGGMVGDTTVACQIDGPASSSTDTAETEAPNSCLGQNAREDIDTNGNTYGYCYSKYYKYYTTGWRIAYVDSNSKPVIISAGSPECNSREDIKGNITYIKKANTLAMKYCNSDYVDGDCSCLDSDSDGYCDCTDSDSDGLCDEIENGTVDAWAVSDTDFYNMTKAISGVGKRLTSESSSLGDSGGTLGSTLYCGGKYSYEECGYNNDLIDNGGNYWFAARHSSSSTYGVLWSPSYRSVYSGTGASTYGLRPVISLKSSVIVTGGTGTIEEPYTIVNEITD